MRDEVVIQRIYKATKESLRRECCLKEAEASIPATKPGHAIVSAVSGIYEGREIKSLIELCENMT